MGGTLFGGVSLKGSYSIVGYVRATPLSEVPTGRAESHGTTSSTYCGMPGNSERICSCRMKASEGFRNWGVPSWGSLSEVNPTIGGSIFGGSLIFVNSQVSSGGFGVTVKGTTLSATMPVSEAPSPAS